MTASRNKKTAKAKPRKEQVAKTMRQQIAAQLRPGMPAADSVRAVVDFVSPQKVHYTILKTSEMDAYDEPIQPKPNKKRRQR
jgi:hypothetical protein